MSNYVKFFQHFIPEKVEIKDVNDVNNIFKEEIIEEEMNTTNDLINVEEVESGPTKEPSEAMGDEDDFFYDTNKYMALFQINIIKKDEKNLEYIKKKLI